MALFKIFGNFASGNTTLPTSATQGYCYFDKNTGKFYIDTATSNTAALGTNRLALNADKADKDGNGNVISTTYLPTSQANINQGTITLGSNSITPITEITAGAGLNTTSNDTGTDGGSITTTGTLHLTKSGVTAGTYGPTANVTGTNNATIKVPQVTVDKYGRVTSVVERTYTSKYAANTDTKVTQAAATTASGDYPVLLAYSTATSAVTNSVNKTSTLKYNPDTQTLTVPNLTTDKAKIGLQDNSGSSIEVGSTLKINDGTSVGTAGQALLSDGTKAYWGTVSGGSSGDYVLKSGDIMTGSLITQQYVVAGNDGFDGQAHIQAKSNAGRIGFFSGDSTTGTTGFMQIFAQSKAAGTGKTIISIAHDANNTTTLYGNTVDISDGAIKLTNTLNNVWIGLSCGGGSASGNVGIYRHGYHNGTTAVLSGSGSSGMMIYTRPDGAVESQFKFYGAVFNDYAEYRETKEDIEPGRCITENGDGSLKLTTERLMRGCEIVSDTFGFAIGETKRCKTPTAASGRVLAYCLEGQEYAKNYIGWPVCSGPNGTVSIMTEEEEIKYPSRIIGTISEVPNYDIWHCGKEEEEEIQVNGRIWIRIK